MAERGPAGLTAEQTEVFAAGLVHLAAIDGMTPVERALIVDWLAGVGRRDLIARLDHLTFDPVHAWRVLETSWLRGLFLQAVILVIRADHVITAAEREALVWLAHAFGVDGGYEGLLERVGETRLDADDGRV